MSSSRKNQDSSVRVKGSLPNPPRKNANPQLNTKKKTSQPNRNSTQITENNKDSSPEKKQPRTRINTQRPNTQDTKPPLISPVSSFITPQPKDTSIESENTKLKEENSQLSRRIDQLEFLIKQLTDRVETLEVGDTKPQEKFGEELKWNEVTETDVIDNETHQEMHRDINARLTGLEAQISEINRRNVGVRNFLRPTGKNYNNTGDSLENAATLSNYNVPEYVVRTTSFNGLPVSDSTAALAEHNRRKSFQNAPIVLESDEEKPRFHLAVDTKWQFEARIGVGAFGEVWLASRRTNQRTIYRVDGDHSTSGASSIVGVNLKKKFGDGRMSLSGTPEKVVIKRITKESIGLRWENPANEGITVGVTMPTEAMLMAKVGRHPNLMPLLETYEDTTNFYFVMPCLMYRPRDLELFIHEHVTRSERISQHTIRKVFKQVLRALNYLHVDRRIAHRDLKPSNIIVNDNLDVCVIDLGLAHRIRTNPLTNEEFFETVPNGTPVYTPPEVHLRIPYKASKTDIWAAGCILYELVEGVRLFDTSEEVGKIRNRQSLFSHLFARRTGPPWPLGLDKLVEKLLDPDPNMRPDSETLLNDPWLMDGMTAGTGW
ncbi:Sperm motility kinase 2A [Nowakowskiella sp. JEL0407]|nr:Sperm motility kinase 2A [Nowakowskiella sp. JEL0407]